MQEVWKDVVGYEGAYMVSNLGRVKSLPRVAKNRHGYRPIRERVLKPAYKNGYLYVSLKLNTKSKTYAIHRLVAEAFIPNPYNKPCVDHINSIRDDNREVNLTWATYSENNLRAISRLGSNSKRGEDHSLSKLSSVQVLEINSLLEQGLMKQKDIADLYGISSSVISNIYRGISWNWLTNRKSRPGGHYAKSK